MTFRHDLPGRLCLDLKSRSSKVLKYYEFYFSQKLFFNSSQENKEAYSFEISKDLVWVSLKISAEIPIVVMRSYVDLDGEMVWSHCKIFWESTHGLYWWVLETNVNLYYTFNFFKVRNAGFELHENDFIKYIKRIVKL